MDLEEIKDAVVTGYLSWGRLQIVYIHLQIRAEATDRTDKRRKPDSWLVVVPEEV